MLLSRRRITSKFAFFNEEAWHITCVSSNAKEGSMKILRNQQGAIGWVLLWLLGIPIPILLILFLVRGCT
jgi:hypothetical protein